MADFAPAFAATMKAEGGYVNDPHCTGGETCKGAAILMNPIAWLSFFNWANMIQLKKCLWPHLEPIWYTSNTLS